MSQLDAADCCALIAPLTHLRVALAAAIGGTDFGALHVEYYCEQLDDDAVFGATRARLRDALTDASRWQNNVRQRLRRVGRDRTVLGSEIATLLILIGKELAVAEKALAAGHVESHPLYRAGKLAQTAMRLLTGRLERIAQGYVPEPERLVGIGATAGSKV